MGDAFYRWDGFSYYASFSEYLPAVGLVFILWSSIAVLMAVILWLFAKVFSYTGSLLRLRIEPGHSLLCTGFFVILVAAVLKVKKAVWPLLYTTLFVKLTVVLLVALLSVILAWKLSDRFSRWLQFIDERITPLVWLFGVFVLLSVPVVSYQTWFNGTGKAGSEKIVSSTGTGNNRPNIILVTFDALTARDMSAYGYHRDTTPFMTEWAKSASVFTRVEASSTLTTSTTASLMTGKRVWSHMTYQQGGSIQNGNSENILRELKKNGYHTMTYIENSNASPETLGISESIDEKSFMLEGKDFLSNFHTRLYLLFHGKIRLYNWLLLDDFYPTVLMKEYVYYPIIKPVHDKLFSGTRDAYSRGYTLLDKFITDIDKHTPTEPFFVWIHLYPPHAPYVPPVSYQGIFDQSQELRTFHEQEETWNRITEHQDEGKLTEDDFQAMKLLRGRYNEHILYSDKEFEDFIKNLEKKNILKNTVVMLSADHGESFEHNHWGHGGSPYEPVVHIPLIIKEPNQSEGRIINDVVEQIDISATIMDFAHVSAPSWVEGRTLLPLIRGEGLPPKFALSMYFEQSPSRRHKIIKGFINGYESDNKLIYYIEENRALLFNLKDDPDEMKNLFDKETKTGQHLLGLIKDKLESINKRNVKGE